MTRVQELAGLGQSIWFDYIRREFLLSGEFQDLIDAGVTGVTSNPAIFAAAIAGSADYDRALEALSRAGKSTVAIYETLAIEDIQNAADLLRPVYERTQGEDGYVSLEVSPTLADDTTATIAEARRLKATVNRPNVMIKVPATPAGIPAIETLISEGININVTLMFSLAHYEAVAQAYILGLDKLAASGGDLSKVASVASFFLSRIDAKVDDRLAAIGSPKARALLGKTAIANAKVTYQRFRETFSGSRWRQLAGRGARVQRVLWASTSTKNPAYPDTMYVDELIGPDTVNTVPPETLQAFFDHGKVAVTVTKQVEEAQDQLDQLANLGIDLGAMTEQLQEEGVKKFVTPFESLLENIAGKVAQLGQNQATFTARLGEYQGTVDTALAELKDQRIMNRIWDHDYTIWKPQPEEISNRLGWLHLPEEMANNVGRIMELATAVRAEGYSQVLLLGMGGSSLAPEVFANVFGHDHDGLALAVLDSTDPEVVRACDEQEDLAKTLFIVATKSGGTVETLSFFKFFYNRTVATVGRESAGEHFVAITDVGSKLDQLAEAYDFRAVFLNDPNIGGRYAALSYFGLVPAGLVGVDLPRLLESALLMSHSGMGGTLGVIMGELAKQGRDKVTLISSPGLANFGDWIEQLIAESTGKDGKGILPVVGEPLYSPGDYSQDRLFVYLCLDGDQSYEAAMAKLAATGQPLVTLDLKDRYDLGGQFFLWEMATAVAGNRMGIQPFDQPNVESAKILAREMVTTYQKTGKLPAGENAPLSVEALLTFLDQSQTGDYIAIQAFVPHTTETSDSLEKLREMLGRRTRLPTTVGFGPRFLHSTGQLHKGDGGNGLFIQFASIPEQDLPIPDEAGQDDSSMDFGVLKIAQALGDAAALREAKRRVISFQVTGSVPSAISKLVNGLS